MPKNEFNLDKIPNFAPIIYSFEAEASLINYDPSSLDYLYHGVRQVNDVFAAYQYVQENMLPEIKKTGLDNITPTQVLEWLDQIHIRIATTLANDYKAIGLKNVIAGAASPRVSCRWHQGLEVKDFLVHHLANQLPEGVDIYEQAEKAGLDRQIARGFIQLMERIRDNKSIPVLASEAACFDYSPLFEGEMALLKLVTLYRNNSLTKAEKNIVNRVLKIRHPDDHQAARVQFAQELLNKWRSTDCSNNDQLTELAYFIFHTITDKHWYFNCNGRSATCFMNAVLFAERNICILMREPNEKADPFSSYRQAIDQIGNPEILKSHLKARIVAASEGKNYTNERLKEIIVIQVKLSHLTQRMQRQFPGCDVKQFYKNLHAELEKNTTEVITDIDGYRLQGLTNFLDQLQELQKNEILRKYKIENTPEGLAKGLRNAVVRGELEDIHTFIELKVDVNMKDPNFMSLRTALHWAAITGNIKAVEILLQANAKLDIKDKDGKTAKDYAKNPETLNFLNERQVDIDTQEDLHRKPMFS